ncbi:MAG: hypothetical protein GY867_04875 [bacterium]|nr:hypothetical protein [bacterium]
MKYWHKLLFLLCLAPTLASSQVAKTYEIEPSATTGIASGTAVDVIEHRLDSKYVWLATGKGLNFSFDGGEHWFVVNSTNGLPSDNLSAVFSAGPRIWVASNHNEFIESELRTLSDGVTYSDDYGDTWTRINFGSDGLDIPFVWGGDRTIYDITGHFDEDFFGQRTSGRDAEWLFFTAFAGGFLASQDGGLSWRRIFPSQSDSIQFNLDGEAPSERNRYFSCVSDTSHTDSLIVWAGTAGGVFQYMFAPPSEKLFSRSFYDVAFCDTCSAEGTGVVFFGGGGGVSTGRTTGGPYTTSFATDGLPGQRVSALTSLGEYLVVGTIDTATTASTGLALSTDLGNSFTPVTLPEVVGLGRDIREFARVDDRLYMAATEAGLFVSSDSGRSWDHISLDTIVGGSLTNHVNAVSVVEDSLLVGTDSGFVALQLDVSGNVLDFNHTTFTEDDTSSSRVVKVKAQPFLHDTTGVVDSTAIWTINIPVTGSGTSFIGRRTNSGVWSHYQVGITNYDINIIHDTAFAMGESSVGFTARGTDPVTRFPIRQYVGDQVVVETFSSDTVTSMAVKGDTVIFTSLNGLAISNDRGLTYTIVRPNTDSLKADLVIGHNYLGSGGGVPGDFIPALGVQYMESGPARIWVSGRPVDGAGFNGVGYGEYQPVIDTLGDTTGFDVVWNAVLDDDYAWNFEFLGEDSVFLATNEGLLFNDGALDSLNTVWDTIHLIDEVNNEELVEPLTAVFGVGAIDSLLWVGSNDGIVAIRLDDFGRKQLYMRVDSNAAADEVYAFPVPFRPGLEQELDFHFVVEQAGSVTLEIYDFAMNLVARPIDNVFYEAGIYPDGSSQGRTWDGRNGKGDLVAVGVYYFKVEFDSGEARWAKLAVMP